MCADHRLCTIKKGLFLDLANEVVKVLATLPCDLRMRQAEKNLLCACRLMNAYGFCCRVAKVFLVAFVSELISRYRVAVAINGDLPRSLVSQEPNEGADVGNLGHQLLVLAPAGPGNYRSHESRSKCRNLHVKAKAVSGVGELFAVGGHRGTPPTFLLLLIKAVYGAAWLDAQILPHVGATNAASQQQCRRFQRAASHYHLWSTHGDLGFSALCIGIGCFHAGCTSLLDENAISPAMNDDPRSVLIGIHQERPSRRLFSSGLIAKPGVASHERLEQFGIPIGMGLPAKVIQLRATFAHAQVGRVEERVFRTR